MKKQIRKSKDNDQENVSKAYNLLLELMELNYEIEGNIWGAAFMFAMVNGYINSGFTYEEYKKDLEMGMKSYKDWFDNE